MIPVESKQAYLEAVRLAPSLVKNESNPIMFLRCEDFNAWTAARRLVMQWDYRKRIFGQNRWLLPLHDESGAGALNEEDLQVLQSGWVANAFPPNAKPGYTFLVNHGRYMGKSVDSVMRTIFYLQTVSSDVVAQTAGVTLIRLVPSKTHGGEPPLTPSFLFKAQKIVTMTMEALPIRVACVILLKEEVQWKPENALNFFLDRISNTLISLMRFSGPMMIRVPQATVACEQLANMGLYLKDVLPVCHGGTWTYDRMFEWKNNQRRDDADKLIQIPWLQETRKNNEDKAVLRKVRALHARR